MEGADEGLVHELADIYFETKEGLGLHKPPEVYGAFTTDPYSHTPRHAGVQQPGMTGQVKEDILSYYGELGIQIDSGKIRFNPQLLDSGSFSRERGVFHYISLTGDSADLKLPAGTLAFTFCQVPVVYHLTDKMEVRVKKIDGSIENMGPEINTELSQLIFNRAGEISQIDVFLNEIKK
jgi:hypothetical protein